MTALKNVIIELNNSILRVIIDREKVLNALNSETVLELQHVFDSHRNDDSVRCVILTGSGDRSFVAGADITELTELDVRTGTDFSAGGLHLTQTIQNFPSPVIAAINGFALGGGCELALACDIRLASEKAKFGQPEVNLGLIPGFGGTQRLARLVGRGKATQLTVTGEIISADEAYRIGLVDEVYPHDQLHDRAMEMAELIASKAPLAVKAAKDAINRGLEVSQLAGLDIEKINFGQICGTADKGEGTKAFIEKRKAKFEGR